MFLALRRFILAPWTSFLLHVSTLWGFLLFQQEDPRANDAANPVNNDTADAQADRDTANTFPPTEEQLEERIKKFIVSLDEDAICRLASQHNGQKPCRVVGRDRGSFNVCFFIHFDQDGGRWVVRIPLEPVVQHAWDKVQSEVATMRYLQCSTSIPIPRVHAYGQDAGLVKGYSTEQAFLICDHIAGQPLNMRMPSKATKEQRMRFYGDLIDILAQLYQLEFSAAGSLMPNAHNEADPTVGGLLPMAANELGRCCQDQGAVKTFASARQYMDYQYRVLSKTYSLPTEELSRKQAQMELFALDSLEGQIPLLVSSQRSNDPFMLAHMDLRCRNIMATEDLRIHAIID
ncbi:APH domain-containing protein [Fusarium keratoplasticum]|nr:APH domain-containing protein [Fusarium keratoplasticum]